MRHHYQDHLANDAASDTPVPDVETKPTEPTAAAGAAHEVAHDQDGTMHGAS